ncbi:unnamed protein product [Urochloa decumbens]|uniref:Disease resistance N-terminal domain-containing protein n=1 Tax=Urochloa decumbens TaxID=240449 RepID=A0ABC8YG69_9POAL
MAGLIASGIIKWTASKLSSLVSAPIEPSSSSDEHQTSAIRDVQMLRRTMASVQSTLEVADEDSIRDESGRLRLRELQQFAYDAQDAIDEYKFELLRRRMDDPDSRHGDRSIRKGRQEGMGRLQEPDGASYDQEVLEALRDDSKDDFGVFSEDEDDDFYNILLEAGQSSGMAIDYDNGSDDDC